MILNSNVNAPQQLGNVAPTQTEVKAYNFIMKIQNMKSSTFAMIVGAVIYLVFMKKINYKPKTFKIGEKK